MIKIEKVKEITEKSGCYLFKNKNNIVIYVGKAKNLKKRTLNYFQKDEENIKRNFISQIEYIDVFVTENQKEALILEQNLIKKHQPRYNVLLKNNNAYPYIQITNSKNPRYILSYKVFKNYGEYFGPFPDGSRAKEILSLLERVFPLAKCKESKQKKACIYYTIGQCSGYCFKEVETNYYEETKKNVVDFFNGKTKKIKEKIKESFTKNINNLSFEIAQKQKKILDSIDFFVSSQNVEFSDRQNRDFIGTFAKKGVLAMNILIYRYGKLITSHEKIFSIENQFADQKEIIQSYIFQFYEKNLSPRILYSSENIQYKKELEEELKLTNITPKIGKMKKVLELANSNAEQTWNKHFLGDFQKIRQLETLKKIAKIFKIKTPYHIEALDISNIFLQDAVASFSYFINGEYNNSKLYKLSPERSDFDYMKKACEIHYKDTDQEKMPDLIIVDGAREQIKSVKDIIKKLKLKSKIIGLIKNDNHKTEKMMNENLEEILFESEEVKNFLTQIQEKVHESAIRFHRKLHEKGTLKVNDKF
ncbi:MAG: UvrABC system protein C [Mycoplasmataceae bacterium]|nr:MAG: UvrABC system protein C [Mycoplasmataceae bacterium]